MSNQRLLQKIEIQSMIWLGILFLAVFSYIPMIGVIISFKDYDPLSGFLRSPWVGLKYFKEFIHDPFFLGALKNTLGINILGTFITFPAPILFALILNEMRNSWPKKATQTISYLPHFVSWVIFAGMILDFLGPGQTGILNSILLEMSITDTPIDFIGNKNYSWTIIIGSQLIKGLGWGAIIYLASLAGVDPNLYEAASIDGCSRLKKILYITLPSIWGAIAIMLIFQIASILNSGFERIYIFQNNLNLSATEVLDTYVYRVGLKQNRFSYATAAGLAKSILAVILLTSANKFSKKTTGKGLF